jgi:hypothetical protein
MCDGSVLFISKEVSQATLRAAITRNGHDVLGSDWDYWIFGVSDRPDRTNPDHTHAMHFDGRIPWSSRTGQSDAVTTEESYHDGPHHAKTDEGHT